MRRRPQCLGVALATDHVRRGAHRPRNQRRRAFVRQHGTLTGEPNGLAVVLLLDRVVMVAVDALDLFKLLVDEKPSSRANLSIISSLLRNAKRCAQFSSLM